jgi:uncharacterized protein YcfJ
MNKLLTTIGAVAGGWIGWWIGDKAGLVAALVLSGIGSIAGVYIGWRITRDYLE